VTCHELERWLDEGMPPTSAAAFVDHAKTCPACGRAYAAALALEGALSLPPAMAPAGFADRVLARIGHPRLAPVPVSSTPWWLRALIEPSGLLALLLIAVMATGWEVMWSVLGAAAIALAQITNGTVAAAVDTMTRTPWGELLGRHEVLLGLELGTVCLAVVVLPVLYRLSLRVALRAAGAAHR